MSAWLVTAIPPGALLIGLIVLIAGGSALIQRQLRRRFPALIRDEHNDVTKFTYGFIGFVYAFFIGFVVSAMWGQVNTTDVNARAEGGAAVQMATDSSVFDAPDRDRVRQALLAYERAAIDEWTGGSTGRSSEADAALVQVYAAYGQVQTTSELQKTLLATSFSNLDNISQARTVRLFTAHEDTGPPWPLWAVIFITSGMVLATVIVYGEHRPALHYPMVIVAAVVVASNLFLILELSHPFLGGIATTPDPLREAVSMLSPQVS